MFYHKKAIPDYNVPTMMNKQLQEGTLTLFLEGEINSNNSEAIGAEIDKAIEGETFSKLVFDFKNVVYVSSAGLRIILRFKQKYALSLVIVSVEVYDVFQMTGFTSIMPISKILRVVNVTKDQLIGEGYFSYVYRIDKDTIVKVFKFANDTSDIEREMSLAREAFILGIPTAITFDIVRVGDKYGVQFEMLDSVSLRDELKNHPEEFDKICKDYANLLKIINTTSTDNPALPSAKAHFMKKYELAKEYLTEEESKKLLSLLEAVPERRTFVHGDCHVKNILIQNGEMFLIDMDSLSVGDPIFELAGIHSTYIAFEDSTPGNNEIFLGLPAKLCSDLLRQTITYYFGGWDEDKWNAIRLISYVHMIWWNKTFSYEQHRHDVCLSRVKELLPLVNNVALS